MYTGWQSLPSRCEWAIARKFTTFPFKLKFTEEQLILYGITTHIENGDIDRAKAVDLVAKPFHSFQSSYFGPM